jgi:hypothetical protein
MFKCANCSKDAEYTYRVNGAIMVHYCDGHLPHFLQQKKLAGLLPLVTPTPEEPEKTSKKKTVAEPEVEEELAPEDADN